MKETARDELELTIDGLGAAGDGVGRLPDGRVVFVPRALPGDHARVRLGPTRKHVLYAELLAVVRPSPDRVESRCRLEACGGCSLRALTPAAQAGLKRRRAVETLRRIGGLDVEGLVGPTLQAGDGWRSRHRVRLHAASSGGRWRLGYFERRSRKLVGIDGCPLLWSELEETAVVFADALQNLDPGARLEGVELAYSRRDGRAAARLTGLGPMDLYRRWIDGALRGGDAGVTGVSVESGGRTLSHGNVELRYDHGHASEFDLRFEPGVFTQAHPEMNVQLVAAVMNAVRPEHGRRVLELHAGIGNFSVPLTLAGVALTAVERHRRTAILGRRNARGAGVEIEIYAASDADATPELTGFRTVLLDPPRTGAREVVERIAAAQNVERVVYVACDAATLARDAAILVRGGFQVATAQAFDMFPHTPHVEVLLTLVR